MKKKNYYLRGLIIYCLVLAIILGAGLFVLNRFLVSYEASRPDNSVEAYMDSHDRQHWLDGLQQLISRGFSEFTLTSALPADFGIDETGEVTWRSAGGDEMSKTYEVRLGKAKICTLSLSPAEDVGFGMSSWKVTGEEFHMPGGSDITITVPAGCTASINGIEVGSAYAVGVETLGLETKHVFDIAPSGDKYIVEDMMGPAELKAFDPEGRELQANSISATELEFYPIPEYSFSFYTLPDAEVAVNGTVISTAYASEAGDELLLYECSELYTQPEISVTTAGAATPPAQLNMGTCFIPGTSPVIEGEMAEFLEGFIYAYVDFTANKNHAADANFAVMAQYLMPGSEFYTLTANSVENIAWATTSGLEYHGIDYYDLIPLGGGKYICSISYDISYTLGPDKHDIQSSHIVFIEELDGKYYVTGIDSEI